LKIYKIFLLVLLIVASNIGFSQKKYTDIENQARVKLFNLKFNEVNNLLSNSKSSTSYYLMSYNLFLQNLLVGGASNFNKFEKQFEISSEYIEKTADDSLKYVYLSELYLQNSVLKLMNRDFFSGAMSFIKSYGLFKDAEKKYPNSFYNIKLSALYNIIGGITPDKGKMFLSTIGLKGNIAKGLKQMNSYVKKSERNKNYYSEAYIMNKLIVAFMKEDVGEIKLPNPKNNIEFNSLNIFTDIMIEYKEHNYTNINKNVNILSKQNITELPYLYYIIGVVNSINNTKKASLNLKTFLKKNKSKHFVKATNWQLARLAVLNNDTIRFKKYQKLTIEDGTSFTEADKQADAESQLKTMPNRIFLKARLLFDAGKYKQAKVVLLDKENKTLLKTNDEYAEFFYRLARIYSMLNDNEKAKKYFKLVIDKQKLSERYFAPYSALQLGIIYENENNRVEAKKFYNIAIEINNGEYKNSIKHKAKSRLKKLN